jgi:hypothetical protein
VENLAAAATVGDEEIGAVVEVHLKGVAVILALTESAEMIACQVGLGAVVVETMAYSFEALIVGGMVAAEAVGIVE